MLGRGTRRRNTPASHTRLRTAEGHARRLVSAMAIAAALALVALVPAVASAHIERASYWPDPAPDCSITPCAGGAVPTARTLASSVEKGGVGTVRVVCQPDSLTRLSKALGAAKKVGYL